MPNLMLKLADGSVARVNNGAAELDDFNNESGTSGLGPTTHQETATGSISATDGGNWGAQTATFYKIGNVVTMVCPALSATTPNVSNFVALTGVPASMRPAAGVVPSMAGPEAISNSVPFQTTARVTDSGALVITGDGATGGFLAAASSIPTAPGTQFVLSWTV